MKTYAKRRLQLAGALFLLALSLFFFSGCSRDDSSLTFFDLAAEQQIHTLSFELDLDAIYKKTDEWQDAMLMASMVDGETFQMPVSLKTRGNSRQNFCSFPPLKLNVEEHAWKDMKISSGKYKLVTHCLDVESGEPLVFREYLAYQLYSQLTDVSYRTHLVKVRYIDREGNQEPINSWMILLENDDELEERLDAVFVDEGVPIRTVQADRYNLFSVFQYMIGNTDWNLNEWHNVKMLRVGEDRFPTPVPYDFDLSGLVNAPYAEPHPMIPIDSVKERFFQWRGEDPMALKPTVDFLKARKDRMLDVCYSLSHLEISERKEIVGYLEDFFNRIDLLWSQPREVVNQQASSNRSKLPS
jgi:hypothetical protein